MEINNRDTMNQVIGMLYAIETTSNEDGVCSVAHDARAMLVDILISEKPLTIKEEGE